MNDLRDKLHIILFVSSALLLIGIANLPIGYYTFIRFTTSIAAGLYIYSNYEKGFDNWNIVFGVILLFFNPIFRVYLHDKAVWAVIDLVVGGLFAFKGYALWRKGSKIE